MSAFFKQFPFLVWEKILEKLEDPKEKLTLLMADLDLDNSFHHKKAEWQFAAILPIFIKHYEFYDSEEEDTLAKKAVLACRLVSSLCCKTIDKYIEASWDEKFMAPPIFLWGSKSKHLNRGGNISSFLQEMGNHHEHRPPIICRNLSIRVPSLTLDSNEVDVLDDFGTKHQIAQLQLQMLDKVGAHLKGLELLLHFRGSHPLSMLTFYREALAKTPNLKQLEICVAAAVIDNDPIQNADASGSPFLPMPSLSQLKCLEIHFIHSSPLVLELMSIRNYFPGLAIIRMPFALWKDEYNENSKELFPNLKSLDLRCSIPTPAVTVNPEVVKEKALKLLEHFEAPKLEKLFIAIYRDFNAANAIPVKDFGMSCMEKRYPHAIWKCEIDKWFCMMRFFKAGEKQEDEKGGNDDEGKDGGSAAEVSQMESSDGVV